MQKWEYLSFKVPGNLGRIKVQGQRFAVPEYLNYLGDQGWEMVNAAQHHAGGFQLFFKREVTRTGDRYVAR